MAAEITNIELPKDIPYGCTVGAVNVGGIFHLRDPLGESSTEGEVVGIVDGKYKLDKNHGKTTLHDPTHEVARLEINLSLTAPGELKARLETRKLDGGWHKDSWVTAWKG